MISAMSVALSSGDEDRERVHGGSNAQCETHKMNCTMVIKEEGLSDRVTLFVTEEMDVLSCEM